MERYIGIIITLCSIMSFGVLANNQYSPVIWNDLKIDNPLVKDVFVNVNREINNNKVVIPAYIVKSWMKDQDDNPILFLSAQPYVCEHSAIPYANQMIKLKNINGLELSSDNAIPVYAFGEINIEKNIAGLFSSAYTMKLHDVIPYGE